MGESRPRILSANKRMDDVQMAVASEWAGLSLRRIMGFGGRVRGVGQLTLSRIHGRERMDGAQMEVASDWVGLSLRRVLGFCGRVRGGKPSTNEKPRTPALAPGASVNEWTMCKWESLRTGVGLSLRRVVGFGGRVRGGKSSTNEKPRIHEWTMCKWEWFQTGWACPCGGFWVLAGVAVGLDG